MMRSLSVAIAVAASAMLLQAQPQPSPDRAALSARVRAAFEHSWEGYKKYAWGHDELLPVSRKARDWHQGATLLMTPLDALDTMLIMGMKEEARTTQEFIASNLSFDRDVSVQNFEITIRTLGGLLSVYQMTGDARILAKAEDLGTRLLPVFNSPTGMPYRFVNLKTGKTSGAVSNPAEIGTLILEFGTLAKLTGNNVFWEKPYRALAELYKRRDPNTGLVGQEISVETGEWVSRSSHIGGAIDSYYEYLLKCGRLFDDRGCGDMWRTSITSVNTYLADERPNGLWYGVSDMRTGARTETTYGSLHAFFPAILAMGGDLDRATRLQASGFQMWTLHGIEPEELDYAAMQVTSAGYQLRPEIVESAYYLAHYTSDPRYLDMGRTFLESLDKYCRTGSGYTVLQSVVTKKKGDRMHSFWLAETLKYLYLLFQPDGIDFEQVVFNTEAHPLRRVGRIR
jgi:mannosidase alpha-like ER degradation enhancer 2